MKWRLLVLGLWAGACAVNAAEDGGQPLAFTKLPVGARSAALGQAYGSVSGDAYGFVDNPALLATVPDLRIASQWATLPTGRTQQYLAFGRPIDLKSDMAYGLAYNRSGLDSQIEKRRANTPLPDSTFGESASVVTIGLAGWSLPKKLAMGVGIKVLSETLGDASSGGFSADLGLFLHTWPWLDLGLSFQDVSSRLTWNTGTAENVPMVIRSSAVARAWDDRVQFSTEIEKSQSQDVKLRLGIEAWAWPKLLALRSGWNQGLWAVGLGLRFPLKRFGLEAGLDYALSGDTLGSGALQQRISLDLGLGLD